MKVLLATTMALGVVFTLGVTEPANAYYYGPTYAPVYGPAYGPAYGRAYGPAYGYGPGFYRSAPPLVCVGGFCIL